MTQAARYESDCEKYELIDGHECVMFPANIPHLRVQGNLYGKIWTFLRGKRCRVFSEAKVIFDDQNHFIPDISVVCDKSKIKLTHIEGAPDFVCEILSRSTRKNDFGKKKDVYERYGVKEYWIIDPVSQAVDVYILRDGRLILDESYHYYGDGDEEWAEMSDEEKAKVKLSLKLSLYDELEIQLADIFGE